MRPLSHEPSSEGENNAPLRQDFLKVVTQDLESVPKAGMKAIILFALSQSPTLMTALSTQGYTQFCRSRLGPSL